MKKRFLSMFALLLMAATGAMAADGIECSASDKGKVICTDGSIYAKVSDVPTGKTAVAMIAYIDMENKKGLALALSDEGSMTWGAAKTTCEGKSAVAGGTWVLPSKEQWEAMGAVESGTATATALRDGFSSVGGTNMQSGAYWSSTANDANADKAWRYNFTTGFYWENNVNKTVNNYVRACLTFNILVAPPTYSVTLAEGTEDATNWTISPAKAVEGATVTATYSGEKKVKSVKAVKKEVIKPDLLSGVFSVSSTKKVNFSKGNLQATYDGSSWTWAFINNQWDYIGKAAGNTKVTDASPFISENGTVDLFGWVGASSTWDGVNQYGITSSDARNATNGYGNSATENLKNDWGTLKGTGWRTLTKDEWYYMLNSRSGTRYCKAQVNSKSGVVIFPDGYSHPTGPTAPTNTNTTDAAYTTNSWSGEAWTKMENAGCVFLPAAGYRSGNSVSDAGTDGYYWSNGASDEDRAYCLTFRGDYLSHEAGSYRNYGRSVRLVKDK